MEDMDVVLDKLSSLRSLYRMKHKEPLQQNHDEYATSSHAVNFNTMMAAMKNYIQEACRHKARLKDHAASEEKKYIEEKQTTFLKIEVKRMLSELERLLDILT